MAKKMGNAMTDQLAQDEAKTAEILQFCKQELDFKSLVARNPGIEILPVKCERTMLPLGIKNADGPKYVCISFRHTVHAAQRDMPFLAVRCHDSEIEIVGIDGRRSFPVTTLDELKKSIADAISRVDGECIKRLLAKSGN
jgi:hypothetical protein